MDGENKGKNPIRIDDLEPDGHLFIEWLAINWMMNQMVATGRAIYLFQWIFVNHMVETLY